VSEEAEAACAWLEEICKAIGVLSAAVLIAGGKSAEDAKDIIADLDGWAGVGS
jgi:hypothetical protein